ncbi:Rhodanese-related sulfurtransferase [Desulfocapsa sulfexigens DSM 10523]|uniref:Rhodanese-related sulfurtransferase n=1 Tax=Desulfocapsa sulfexigens (strain DSM 10523 / SB164P1) TaxID=1167006 RepID=M1NCQ4_DESSD|nr:rhodanese-like domain-containing protein [Desulfocapsa sulfexigens]AGF77519.1 Rhodanese-related sulfurtransferase [Desulfocapsa sulfexigens DSM 10523]
MKKISIISMLFIFLLNVAAIFDSYNFLTADEFKAWLEADKEMIIVDIQVKDEFASHHFPGSIETNAFPVKTEAQKNLILPAVEAYKKTGHDVVVICPRGGGGAKSCYSYMKSQGVPEEKLTILKGGVAKWPYREMLVSNNK